MELLPKSQPRAPAQYRRKIKVLERTYSTRSSTGRSSGASTPHKEFSLPAEFEDSSDEEFVELQPKKRRTNPRQWIFDPNVEVKNPEDVTDDMLANVADYVSQKVYDRENGTTCHQCRQKTTDVKTICRSGRCAGGRGLFCGICLKNRYGEDARVALKSADWWCPPCLDICNCSICRNRIGKGATGPLHWLATEKGFPSVRHYLDSLVAKKGADTLDED